MRYIDPSIRLLNKDSVDLDSWYKVWLKSRDSIVRRPNNNPEASLIVGNEIIKDENEYKDRIFRMNLQYLNFPQLAFEIQGSVLFRDILYNINSSAQWATSLRFLFSTYDLSSGPSEDAYPISSEYRGIDSWESQFKAYMYAISKDSRTDHNRLEMPFSISSRYWVSMNLKTLINFISMLKLKMPFFYDIYGKMFIANIYDNLGLDLTDYLVDYVDAGVSQYFSRSDFKEEYKEVDDLVILKIRMGLILYSQFLRQRDTTIKGLYDELIHSREQIKQFKNKVFCGKSPLLVTYYADKQKFLRTVTNRCCNFAMSEGSLGICSWSNILDVVLKDASTQEFIEEYLPCKFCGKGNVKCKFYDDVKFREEGLERDNLRCPIYFKSLKLADEKIDRDQNLLSKLYKDVVIRLNKGEL